MDYSTLNSAFQSVKANHGCAGVDGITIKRFEDRLRENLQRLAYELDTNTYQPLPLLKILVTKKNGEPRKLCIPAVRDRVAQRAVLNIIEPVLEAEFEDCSYAYRRGRSVRQAVYQIKHHYDKGYRWVVDADIDAFFDNVDHEILQNKFNAIVQDPGIRHLVRLWIRAEVWDGDALTVLQKGIPQGSSVSPILANLFLDELDEEIERRGFKYIRYSDDFIILCKNPQDAACALALSKEILDKLLLELDEEQIVSFDQGFKYLGVIFLKSLIMQPFERPKKDHNVLFYPKPFDIQAYLNEKRAETDG